MSVVKAKIPAQAFGLVIESLRQSVQWRTVLGRALFQVCFGKQVVRFEKITLVQTEIFGNSAHVVSGRQSLAAKVAVKLLAIDSDLTTDLSD